MLCASSSLSTPPRARRRTTIRLPVGEPIKKFETVPIRTRRRTRPGGGPTPSRGGRLARGDARQHERLEDRRAPGRGVRARRLEHRGRAAPRLRPRLTGPAARRPVTRVFALGTVGAIDFAQNGRCEMQQPDIIHRPPPPPPPQPPPRPVPPRPPAPPQESWPAARLAPRRGAADEASFRRPGVAGKQVRAAGENSVSRARRV